MGVKLQGLDEVLKKLEKLQNEARYKGGRFALRKASEVVKKEAAANAAKVDDPKTPEEIHKNIAVRWSPKTFRQSGNLHFRVGILGGAQDPSAKAQRKNAKRRGGRMGLADMGELAGKGKGNLGGDTYYWRFLEFGTQKMAAQPFMRSAMETKGSAAAAEFVTQFGKAVDRAIKKGGA